MKKIIIFSLTYYPNYIGGAEVAIKEITDRILPADYEFHMITLRFNSRLPREEKIGNVHVHRIGFAKRNAAINDLGKLPLFLNKYFFPFTGFLKAVLLHRKYGFDGIWNMMATYSAFAGLFFKLTHPKVKYLLTLQEGDPIDYIRSRVKFVYPLFRKIFTKADFIQTISNYLANWAKSEGYGGHLLVVPQGVDSKYFSQPVTKNRLDLAREHLAKKEGNVYLVTTSRLVKKNACDDVIKALAYLPSNIHFIIIGIGPDEAMLHGLAEKLKVVNRVRFLGEMNRAEMPVYLQSSDIFIRPSLSEGFGISFIEAMAAGLPVIATQEGGIADFLFDPERNPDKAPTGRAVNPRDPKGIARAVEIYLSDKKTTKEIVNNARKMVFAKYDWNHIARDMKEKVFDKVFSHAN
ncbi:MAG: glycosyltransferase family 4 protein [Patescibacteria group bacterium]